MDDDEMVRTILEIEFALTLSLAIGPKADVARVRPV
jgi:hypothetical protein